MVLRVLEIYRSLQGETSRVGLPVVIIRLAGCNLSCRWCDTPEAKDGGLELPLLEVVERALALSRCPWPHDPGH
ncbi:MAG: hypothetical protein FJ125_05110, partial [Deltaproteobacteria bacterium]|nr:hypothetical protein [Deltaproteobacteria bacterium]